ncbi:MAG: class I adenylate-forming enzyme family protein [Deltaproteobacteria bacterium]
MNLFFLVQDAARKWPDDPAVIHGERSFSYAEIHRAVECLASELNKTGVRPGDKVGVVFPNSPEYIVAFFAVLRVGAIVVPVSAALKAPEIANLARDFALDAFCYSVRFNSVIPRGDEESLVEAAIFQSGARLCIKLAASQDTPASEREQLLKLDTACIAFSSGTTSKAKGVILSHGTILERARMGQLTPPITKATAMVYMRPMDRTTMPYQICACLLAGGRVVIADSLNLESLPGVLREHRVDQIYAGPLFYQNLIHQDMKAEDASSVQYFISGGGPLSPSVAETFQARFHREILQSYGCIECAPMAINVNGDARRRSSIGKLVPQREVKLVSLDSESGAGGTVGEIFARGPGLFDGYYKPWRLREEVLEDGWFRTGDIARRDADGYYWIIGRTKEVINVGGFKVFPYEVEAVLLSHPEVEEAMVFGAPEARFGEVARARVKLNEIAKCTERELLRYANERLSVFEALRSVEFVEEIPKTVTGKPRRVG